MLFNRFSWVIVLVALLGVGAAQIVGSAQKPASDFAVGERLKQWRLHDAERACREDPKVCDVVFRNLNAA